MHCLQRQRGVNVEPYKSPNFWARDEDEKQKQKKMKQKKSEKSRSFIVLHFVGWVVLCYIMG